MKKIEADMPRSEIQYNRQKNTIRHKVIRFHRISQSDRIEQQSLQCAGSPSRVARKKCISRPRHKGINCIILRAMRDAEELSIRERKRRTGRAASRV